jgi:hypothetical protein
MWEPTTRSNHPDAAPPTERPLGALAHALGDAGFVIDTLSLYGEGVTIGFRDGGELGRLLGLLRDRRGPFARRAGRRGARAWRYPDPPHIPPHLQIPVEDIPPLAALLEAAAATAAAADATAPSAASL